MLYLLISTSIIEFFTSSDPFLLSIIKYRNLLRNTRYLFLSFGFVAFYVHFIFYERKIHQASSTTVDHQQIILYIKMGVCQSIPEEALKHSVPNPSLSSSSTATIPTTMAMKQQHLIMMKTKTENENKIKPPSGTY